MSSRQVVLVASELPPQGGGIGVFVENLAGILKSSGWECWIATRGLENAVDVESQIIRSRFLRMPPVGDMLHMSRLRQAICACGLSDALLNVHTPYPLPLPECGIATFHFTLL